MVEQIKSSKVGLRRSVRAGGTVFGVGKKGTSKLREVLDGSRVSDVCVAPPPSPLLATPSSFSRLEVGSCEQMLLSKKDCRCFFDQLALPSSIQPWTGRPPVTIAELVDFGGLTLEDVAMLLDPKTRPRRSDVVYPVSLVWCMGFAWSSYVAQSTLLAACRVAGFPDEMVICNENPTPVGLGEAYALATDDVMHFSSSGPQLSHQRMEALDAELVKRGLQKHPGKDETAKLNGTCIGVDLCDGFYFAPHAPRLAMFISAVLETLLRVEISPKGMSALLGVGQWMIMPNRHFFVL